MMHSEERRVLITFLGLGKYTLTQYYLHPDRRRILNTNIAGAAIANLLGPFDRVIAFVTAQSEVRVPELENALGNQRGVLTVRRISAGIEEADQFNSIQEIISALESETADGSVTVSFTLDVSHSFRHLPLLYFAALTYLTVFHSMKVEQILYGQYQEGASQTPIVDVMPAYEFVQWSQAVRSFLDSGRVNQLVDLLTSRRDKLSYSAETSRDLQDTIKTLKGLTHPIGHALPIEIGMCASSLISIFEKTTKESLAVPVLGHLTAELVKQIGPLCTQCKPKSALQLTPDELQRQLNVAKWFMNRERLGDALLLLREYVINVMMSSNAARKWLGQDARLKVENQLAALCKIRERLPETQMLTPNQVELTDNWNRLTRLRNTYAHAGFKQDVIRPERDWDDIRGLFEYCCRLQPVSLEVRSCFQSLLISPLGLSPGALYSAIQKVSPDRLLIISSHESFQRISDVLGAAGVGQDSVTVVELKDPHSGYEEIDGLRAACRGVLLQAASVFCNITGGTSVMSEAARSVAMEARSLGVPVRLLATVDKRPRTEQEADPFVKGSVVWLGGGEANVCDE